jgi:uncharacterized phage protein (TIGR02220 family)
MSFWTDTEVVDNFTPEDKYFMMYCLTNPYTNLVGCYEISIKQMSNDLGYSKDSVESLLKRFMEVHKKIDYDFSTKELFVKNWHKYNWTNSPKLDKALLKVIEHVKTPRFKEELVDIYNSRDTVSIPYTYPMDTSVTDTVTDTDTDTITEIISYLNNKLNTKYRTKNKETQKHIKARLKDGYTLDDFKKVIDKKYIDWHGNVDMEQYLRPQTLFGTKFESYLNAPIKKGVKNGTVKKPDGSEYAEFF